MRIFMALALISLPAAGTTFSPQPIERQLKEADGIVMGHFLRSRSVQLESGVVATQMIFKVQREWGMQSDLFGLDEVIVHYPGGKLGDRHVRVDGVPSFVQGEKVTLFTKNVESRFWGLNLGFGTFKMVNYETETMLVNTLFPHDPRVGQIRLEDFEKKVREIKGSSMQVVRQETPDLPSRGIRAPASVEEGKKRAIASKVEREDNGGDQSSLSVYWLIAILAFSGGLFRWVKARHA